MRRAFLALELPPRVLDAVDTHLSGCVAHRRAAGRATQPGVRWTTRDQWHVTLQFLGRVGDVDAVGAGVADALREQEPFALRLGGGGAFPRPARGSILWLGVLDGRDELAALASAVGEATARLGYEADRHFHPHLTLARARRRRDLRPLIDEIGPEPVGPTWTVREVVCFESDTRPEGAVYTPVSRLALGA